MATGLLGRLTMRGMPTPEEAAFRSGIAMTLLDGVLMGQSATLPLPLLRDRLALKAAAASLQLIGRPQLESTLRDEMHLRRAEEALGPAAAVFDLWRRLATVPLTRGANRALAALCPPDLAPVVQEALEAATGRLPVAAAACTLSTILRAAPREEIAALMLADAALARAAGWPMPVPLLAAKLSRRDLATLSQQEESGPCHLALVAAIAEALPLAQDLDRRAAHLISVAPRLRAKTAPAAVALFLREDALSPSVALSPVIRGSGRRMTDRSARRLCDRLVELGALRELSGRSAFRLYGL